MDYYYNVIIFLQKYSFSPNQRLNFLTGENGSGKSAVLTAIVFVLGGTARMSSRGSSNKVNSVSRAWIKPDFEL